MEIDTENKLLNKVIILDFLKLQEYFLCTKKTKLNRLSHMDYFNDILTTFLGLECVIALLSMEVRKLGKVR